MRLYELTGSYLQLQAQIDAGVEVADALAELSAVEGALAEKGAGIVHVLANLGADVEALDVEIRRLTARKRAAEGAAERLREYVRLNMINAGIKRLSAPTFTITLGEGPEKVAIDDEDALPEAYVRTRREPNKAAILEAYKRDGEIVPGTHIERGTRLTIR